MCPFARRTVRFTGVRRLLVDYRRKLPESSETFPQQPAQSAYHHLPSSIAVLSLRDRMSAMTAENCRLIESWQSNLEEINTFI